MNVVDNDSLRVNGARIIRKGSIAEARDAASEERSATGGFDAAGIIFKQGARWCFSTAIPVRRVRRDFLEVNSAKERGTVRDVQSATNRPLMKEHAANIAQYIRDNVDGRYILPPLTLNIQMEVPIFVPDSVYRAEWGTAFMVVPETARLSVTDGQHRTYGIAEAAKRMSAAELEVFDRQAVAVMITLESDLDQIHQDFADASKTKAIPKSQLAAYDRRNPANGLVLDLIRDCPLFDDKIDSTSKTLSSNSINLFLTNQVRQLVKELLVGDYAIADDQFEIKAKQLLGSSDTPQCKADLDRFSNFVNVVTDSCPVLSEIASLPAGTSRNIIKDRRNEGWICLTATGMVIVGRIGFELFRDRRADWQDIAKKLGGIDWSRSGPLWQNNIVRAGKVTTQRAPVRIAVEKVRREIGLPANPRLDDEVFA